MIYENVSNDVDKFRDKSLEWECVREMVGDPDRRILALEKLNETSFTTKETVEIFKFIKQAVNKSEPVDLGSVIFNCEKVGLNIDISKLMGFGSTSMKTIALKLKEYEILRFSWAFGLSLRDRLSVDNPDALDVSEFIRESASGVMDVAHVSETRSLSDIVDDAVKRIEDACNGKTPEVLKTNHKDYDKLVGGYERGQMIVVAGRPGMGKSTLLYSEALSMAKAGKRVVICSLEIGDIKVSTKLLSNLSNIDGKVLKKGTLTGEELIRLNKAAEELKSMDIHILERHSIKVDDFNLELKRIAMEKPIDICYLDYLQLLHVSGNITEGVTKNSQALKQMAKGMNLVLVALSQLSRSIENRTGLKIPNLSDLRDSGAIEQDADMVTFVYRPDYYGDSEVESFDESYDLGFTCEGKVILVVAKNREGDLGTVAMTHELHVSRFVDIDHNKINEEVNFKNVKSDYAPPVEDTFTKPVQNFNENITIPQNVIPRNLGEIPF